MDKKLSRPLPAIIILAFVCLFMVTRTEGFENIRVIQFLYIFVAGFLCGIVLGIVRSARSARASL